MNNLKCVILAGGLGTRLKESTEFKPKPMIEIGTKPIIWHILKSYYFHGVSNFLISAGIDQIILKIIFFNITLWVKI